MMLWPLFALGLASPAAPLDVFLPYLSCIHRAEVDDPADAEAPVVVAYAKYIEACAEERDRLLRALIGHVDPASSELDRALASNRAHWQIVDAEIELIEQRAAGRYEEGIRHPVSTETVLEVGDDE